MNSTSINAPAGRLEVYLQEEWGTVCSSGFAFIMASVACRQLGYSFVEREGTVGALG